MQQPEKKRKRVRPVIVAIYSVCKRRDQHISIPAANLMATFVEGYMEELLDRTEEAGKIIKNKHIQEAYERIQLDIETIRWSQKQLDKRSEEVISLNKEVAALKDTWKHRLEKLEKRIDELSPLVAPDEVQEHGTKRIDGQSPSVTPCEAREQVLKRIRGLSPSVPPNEVWEQEFEQMNKCIDASVATFNE